MSGGGEINSKLPINASHLISGGGGGCVASAATLGNANANGLLAGGEKGNLASALRRRSR